MLGAFESIRALRLTRLLQTLNRLEVTQLAESPDGLRCAHGRFEGTPLLRSPYQGRPCLYYLFRVLEPRADGKPRLLASGKEWTEVHLEDESGRARVEAGPALVASPRRFEEPLSGLRRIPPERADFFERAGIEERHLARLPQLVVEEFTIEPRDSLYVTGTLETRNGEKRFYRKHHSPLIVSAERDIGYRTGLRHELVLHGALAPLLLLGAAALLLLALA